MILEACGIRVSYYVFRLKLADVINMDGDVYAGTFHVLVTNYGQDMEVQNQSN